MKLTTKLLKKLIKEEFASMTPDISNEITADTEDLGHTGNEIKQITLKYNIAYEDVMAMVEDGLLTLRDGGDYVEPVSDVPRI